MAPSSGGLDGPAAFFLLERRQVRAKTPEDRQLLDLLDPVVGAQGFDLVRLRLMGGSASGRTLQIMAERPEDGDLGIDDCVRLSRAISEVMDAADPVSGEYRLEVSSPGIDRPLTRLKDFAANQGLEAKIELDRLADRRKRFKGVISGVEDVDGQPHVALDMEGEADTVLVPFAWMTDAKLTLSDELMKQGAEKRAARMTEDGQIAEPPEPTPASKAKGRAKPGRGAKPASHLTTSEPLPQDDQHPDPPLRREVDHEKRGGGGKRPPHQTSSGSLSSEREDR